MQNYNSGEKNLNKSVGTKLALVRSRLGRIQKGAYNLNIGGVLSKNHIRCNPENCAKLIQSLYPIGNKRQESAKAFSLKINRYQKIRYNYFFLILFLFSNWVLAQDNVIRLAWSPNTESYLSHYIIYRDTQSGTMKALDQIPKTDSTYTDNTVEKGVTYYYKLTAADANGNESEPSNEVTAKIEIIPGSGEDNSDIVNKFELRQNYPNPFNNSTTISYSIEKDSWVVISIYDGLGRKITTIEESFREAGNYQTSWDGTNKHGEVVATGIYYYQLLAESFKDAKKLILQR